MAPALTLLSIPVLSSGKAKTGVLEKVIALHELGQNGAPIIELPDMKPSKLQNGLTRKTVNCLTKAGIPIEKEAILNALKNGTLWPHRNPRNYGKYTHREICRWAGFDEPIFPK